MRKQLPGEAMYRRLVRRFKGRRKGQVVAIDPKTGHYVIGRDELAVAIKARKAYPAAHFSVFRLGFPAVHKFRRRA